MNILQVIMLGLTLVILGAIGYVFYLIGGVMAGAVFVGMGLLSAYGVTYLFGGGGGGSDRGSSEREQFDSKGARED